MPNILVRQASLDDSPAIARIHVDSWRTAQSRPAASDLHARLVYGEREGRWTQILGNQDASQFVLVAEDGRGRVVGFAAGGRARSSDDDAAGELYAIHMLQSRQMKGIGRELVLRVTERLAQSGLRKMHAWVLADGVAREFCQGLGGRESQRRRISVGDVELEEVLYRWNDVRALGRVS